MKSFARIARYLFASVMLLTACSTDSCSCDGFEQREFPANKLNVTIPAVGQVRVTDSGLDYVESQVPYLMSQVLAGGLSFCIPRDTSGNPDLCIDSTCTSGANGCQVDLELADQSITPMPPDTLDVEVTIGGVDERLNFDYDATLFTVNCYVQLFKKGSSEQTPANVMGTVPVRFFTDQASDTNEAGIDVGMVQLNLDDVDFKIHGRGNVGDTIACEGASLVRGLFRGLIEDEIQGALDGAVDGMKRSFLCRQCGAGLDECPASSTCAGDGLCDYANSCVPRTLGMEGRLDVGALLTGFVREPSARIDVMGKAADLARVDTGVTLGLRAGAEPVAVSDCVPVDPTGRPPIVAIPPSATVTGNSRPGAGAFMLGVGIHKSAIEQALWSVWASGATCLEISDEDVMLLSTTAFSLIAPSMKDLVGGGKSAVLAVVANEPPTVELGANTVVPVGDTYTIADPLVRILWNDVDFHVFAYAQDRMTRMFTLRLDLDLPVALATDGMGSFLPVIPSLETAIANVEPRRLELLTEDAATIADVVPTLLSIAAPQLAGAIPGAIDVPEFLGFRLDVSQDDITAVDNNEFIGVFANLQRSGQPITAVANTAILDQSVSYERVLSSGFVRPEVTLTVHGYAGDALDFGADYEFSWRVDNGLWSMFHRTNDLVVDDAILAIQGDHDIEVRARRIGEAASFDPVPAKTTVSIGWEPPPSLVQPVLDISELVEKRPVSLALAEGPLQPEVDRGARLGCSAVSGNQASGWVLLLCVGMVLSRRRRRAAVLVASVLATGCWDGCKGEVRTNADEFCFGADCIVDQACSVDGDCSGICPAGAGGICEDGACRCVNACDPGCEDDAFCCLTTKECLPYGDLCTEMSCDPGYEPGVTEATPNRETCELADFSCACVALPPVPVGWHGPYTSIDSDGSLSVVATYNKTYGDLMLGVVQPDSTLQWHYVDGVPGGEAVVGDPTGPRGGVEGRGDKVGTHTAVAIDAAGRAHVFYRDEDNDVLKWGVATFAPDGPPKFESAVLDPTPGSGLWTAAVAAGGEIHVVYAVPEAGANSEVRHIAVDGTATPAEATPTVVVSEPTVEQGSGYPAVAGAFLDLTESGGTPFLVFWNGVSNRIGRTQFTGTWAEPTYVAEGTGPWASGWLGGDGLEHLAFMQSSGFRYSRFGDTATSQIHDGLRDLGDEYWTARIGEDSSLRVEAGAVTVAFQDTFDRALIVSSSPDGTTNTSWTHDHRTIDGSATGFWIAMTRRGERWVADMVVDRGNDDSPAYVRASQF